MKLSSHSLSGVDESLSEAVPYDECMLISFYIYFRHSSCGCNQQVLVILEYYMYIRILSNRYVLKTRKRLFITNSCYK